MSETNQVPTGTPPVVPETNPATPEEPKLPKGAITTEPTQQTVPPPAPEDMEKEVGGIAPAVASVSERLGAASAEEAKVETNLPVAKTPQMIDLHNMTAEQASQLKSILSVTPDQVQAKRGNSIVEIRRTMVNEEYLYVVDFQKARMALANDSETGKEFETHKIKVLYYGQSEYTDLMYTDFMDFERVRVEVLSERQEKDVRKEGQVVSRETGRLVEKEVTIMEYFYTVKLPTGTSVEIKGNIING